MASFYAHAISISHFSTERPFCEMNAFQEKNYPMLVHNSFHLHILPGMHKQHVSYIHRTFKHTKNFATTSSVSSKRCYILLIWTMKCSPVVQNNRYSNLVKTIASTIVFKYILGIFHGWMFLLWIKVTMLLCDSVT